MPAVYPSGLSDLASCSSLEYESSLESQVGLGWTQGAGEEVPGKQPPLDLE